MGYKFNLQLFTQSDCSLNSKHKLYTNIKRYKKKKKLFLFPPSYTITHLVKANGGTFGNSMCQMNIYRTLNFTVLIDVANIFLEYVRQCPPFFCSRDFLTPKGNPGARKFLVEGEKIKEITYDWGPFSFLSFASKT